MSASNYISEAVSLQSQQKFQLGELVAVSGTLYDSEDAVSETRDTVE